MKKNPFEYVSRSFFSKATLVVLSLVTVILPFIVLPFNSNFLIDSKVDLLLLAAFVIFLIWAAGTLIKKSIQITLSPFILPLVLFAGIVLLSSFLNSAYSITQLLGMGGVYLSLIIITIFGASLLPQKKSQFFLYLLLLPGLILSLTSLAELMGYGPSRIFNIVLSTQFPTSPVFSLAGSPLIAAQVLFIILCGIIALILNSKKKVNAVFPLVSGVVIFIGFVINAYTVYQGRQTTFLFLPWSISWSIVLDGLKSLKTSLIGVGPANFTAAYLNLKPASINMTPLWNTQFTEASTLPFTLLTTTGLLGFASWIFLVIQGGKGWLKRQGDSTPAAAIFLAAVVVELLFSPSVIILGIQMLALTFWIASEKNVLKDIQLHAFTVQLIKSGSEETQRVPQHTHLMVYLVTLVSVILLGVTGYWLGRDLIGQYFMFTAALDQVHNDALGLYTTQQEAIAFYPYSEDYRRSYSVTNLNLALALSNSQSQNQGQGGQQTSDQTKSQIINLIQQAIREAKVSTQLDPMNSMNWLTLGRVYSNLVGVADQADQWSLAAYTNAITTAPTDPSVHLELGTLYYRFGNFDKARDEFQQAVSLKPDWVNANYNLANAYRQKGQYAESLAEYQTTLSLISNNSGTGANAGDFDKVKQEADQVQQMLDKTAAAGKTGTATPAPVAPVPVQSTDTMPNQNTQSQLQAPVASPASALKKSKTLLQGANFQP